MNTLSPTHSTSYVIRPRFIFQSCRRMSWHSLQAEWKSNLTIRSMTSSLQLSSVPRKLAGGSDGEYHAGRAHDVMALKRRGASTLLNFSFNDYAPMLPLLNDVSQVFFSCCFMEVSRKTGSPVTALGWKFTDSYTIAADVIDTAC